MRRIERPRTVVLTDADPSRFAEVVAIGPKVEEVRPGQVVALPGIAAICPDWECGSEILVREADIGWVHG